MYKTISGPLRVTIHIYLAFHPLCPLAHVSSTTKFDNSVTLALVGCHKETNNGINGMEFKDIKSKLHGQDYEKEVHES